jgi:hypothetical protein
VLTELWESDPFTERRSSVIEALDTDYRWEKGDVFVHSRGGRRDQFRVISVVVDISDDGLKRQVLALRLE